jgi:hypothetical protein
MVVPVPPALAAHVDIDDQTGLMVGNIAVDSPADRAGLERYDVLVRLNGKPVGRRPAHLAQAIGRVGPGKQVELLLIRGGRRIERTIELAEPAGPGPLRYKYARDREGVFRDTVGLWGKMLRRTPEGWEVVEGFDELPPEVRGLIERHGPAGNGRPKPVLSSRFHWSHPRGDELFVERDQAGRLHVKERHVGPEGAMTESVRTYESIEAFRQADPQAFAKYVGAGRRRPMRGRRDRWDDDEEHDEEKFDFDEDDPRRHEGDEDEHAWREGWQHIQNEAREQMQRAREQAERAQDEAREHIERAREQAERAQDEARERMERAQQEARERMREMMERLRAEGMIPGPAGPAGPGGEVGRRAFTVVRSTPDGKIKIQGRSDGRITVTRWQRGPDGEMHPESEYYDNIDDLRRDAPELAEMIDRPRGTRPPMPAFDRRKGGPRDMPLRPEQPSRRFEVEPDGDITAVIRGDEGELVIHFRNEQDLARRRPDLHRAYRRLAEDGAGEEEHEEFRGEAGQREPDRGQPAPPGRGGHQGED